MKNSRKIVGLIGVLLISLNLLGELTKENKLELDQVLKNISFSLGTMHYKHMDIDNEFSKKVLENYLKVLDYNHQYFLQKEVDDIYKKWGTKLDENFLEGNSDAAFDIYERYKESVEKSVRYQQKLLKKSKKLDFSKEEKLIVDREEELYFKTKKEYKEHWKKVLKSSILSLEEYEKLSYEESVERMKKRLDTRLKLLNKKTNDDIYSYFVNSFLMEYDPHTTYLSEKEVTNFNISMKLQLSGIGAVLTGDRGYIKVVKIMPGGAAAKGKELQPEDKIIAIASDGENFEDIMDWPLTDAINLVRGKEGTKVKLRVIPSGSKGTQEYTFVRENIKLENKGARYFIKETKSKNSSYKIGVINLPSFYMDFDAYSKGDKDYKSTTRDVRKILEELNKESVDGVVIDLRNNGGGSLKEVNDLMGLFIPYGPVVQVKGRGRVSSLGDSEVKVYFDKPLVVMVNRLSASASEIFAGAIQDYGRGIIVGTPTFGKGTVQTIKKLELGELKYTNGKFYRITGGSTQHRGVVPDILFPPVYDSEKIGESSLDNPLAWDEVNSLITTEVNENNEKIKKYLEKKHLKRIETDPEFIYNKARYELIKETSKDKEVALNREVRNRERKELEDEWLDITNKKLEGKGKAQLKNYEALGEYNRERLKKDGMELLKDDGEIIEAVKILVDKLSLEKK